jgi:hypothetical protein
MTIIQPTPGDRQRATAMIAHYLTRDDEGVTEILASAREKDRPTALLLALLDTYERTMPLYLTAVGEHAFGAAVEATAQNDAEPIVARGAEVILGYRYRDPDRIAAVMRESNTADGGVPGLFYAIMGIHEGLVPFTRTPVAIDALRAGVAVHAAEENSDEKPESEQ